MSWKREKVLEKAGFYAELKTVGKFSKNFYENWNFCLQLIKENALYKFPSLFCDFLWAFSQLHQQVFNQLIKCIYNHPFWFTEENLYIHVQVIPEFFGKLFLKLAKNSQKGSKMKNFFSICIIEFNIASMSGPGYSIFSRVVKIVAPYSQPQPTFTTISKTIRTLQHHVKRTFPRIRIMAGFLSCQNPYYSFRQSRLFYC
jgi:hypothetical protein